MANEKRLIDANAFLEHWNKEYRHLYPCDMYKVAIANFPTVDAVEVVRGRWLYDSGTERHFCSACNEYALSATTQEQVEDYDWEENLVFHLEPVTKEFWTDYCPNCGAKMDGDGNG